MHSYRLVACCGANVFCVFVEVFPLFVVFSVRVVMGLIVGIEEHSVPKVCRHYGRTTY